MLFKVWYSFTSLWSRNPGLKLYIVWQAVLIYCACCTSFHIHSSVLTFFLCVFDLFQSCCSHEQVLRTLVHEFYIFYSHAEWKLLVSLSKTEEFWKYSFGKLISKILGFNVGLLCDICYCAAGGRAAVPAGATGTPAHQHHHPKTQNLLQRLSFECHSMLLL